MAASVFDSMKLVDITVRRLAAEVMDPFVPRMNVPTICRVAQGMDKQIQMNIFTPEGEQEGAPPVHVQFITKFSARFFASEDPTNLSDPSVSEPVVAKIDAEITVLYHLVSGASAPDPNAILKAGQTTIVLQAWPYWREIVQSCTDRLGLPRAIVPPLALRVSNRPARKPSVLGKKPRKLADKA